MRDWRRSRARSSFNRENSCPQHPPCNARRCRRTISPDLRLLFQALSRLVRGRFARCRAAADVEGQSASLGQRNLLCGGACGRDRRLWRVDREAAGRRRGRARNRSHQAFRDASRSPAEGRGARPDRALPRGRQGKSGAAAQMHVEPAGRELLRKARISPYRSDRPRAARRASVSTPSPWNAISAERPRTAASCRAAIAGRRSTRASFPASKPQPLPWRRCGRQQ